MSEFITVWEHNEPLIVGEKIVRCRDCKYYMAYAAAAYCDYLSHAVDAELNGFCAWGERE